MPIIEQVACHLFQSPGNVGKQITAVQYLYFIKLKGFAVGI